MSAQTRPPKPPPVPKRDVKILMLHGYTQSGPLFRAKTRAVEKMITKSLAQFHINPVLIYPTAPNRLRPSDIPGYRPEAGKDDEDTDAWAWWRRDDATGAYRLLPEGMKTLATTIREVGGVHGVMGFSQGGCAASLLAAALEDRKLPESTEGYGWQWVEDLREANMQQPLRFAVIYSGFHATPTELQWLYKPAISTPTLQYIGGLDTVVDESRTQALVDHSQAPVVLTHPGGHYVPVNKEWVMPLVAFVKQHSEEQARI